MQKFRKRPVEIEAIQWDMTLETEAVLEQEGCKFQVHPGNPDYLIIQTLEGSVQASPWDWIVKGVEGEFYPVKPRIFEKTHEPV